MLLTSHERRDKTLACLAAVAAQTGGHQLDIVLVDASSKDGTAAAVQAAHPGATVEIVADDVYWNGGMRRAWELAVASDPEGYLWLNDDTLIDVDAVDRLVDTLRTMDPATLSVVVGSTRDPASGTPTYGGVVRPSARRPLAYQLVPPGDAPRPAETMNGNLVLVPRNVTDTVGLLDEAWTHGMGDYDYGHRVVAAGGAVWVAPGTFGTCPRNAPWEPADSGAHEWRRLKRPTGLPPAEFAKFARRWAGPAWPIYWASPYVRQFARHALRRGGRPGQPG